MVDLSRSDEGAGALTRAVAEGLRGVLGNVELLETAAHRRIHAAFDQGPADQERISVGMSAAAALTRRRLG